MTKINERSATATTNQIGVAMIMWLGTSLPNENPTIDPSAYLPEIEKVDASGSVTKFQSFDTPQNPNYSIVTEIQSAEKMEEQVILEFGEKLLSNSQDIDPEISRIIKKRFWEMV